MVENESWDEAVVIHLEYALIEIEAAKSYFNEGDEETEPDEEYEQLENIEREIKKLQKQIK